MADRPTARPSIGRLLVVAVVVGAAACGSDPDWQHGGQNLVDLDQTVEQLDTDLAEQAADRDDIALGDDARCYLQLPGDPGDGPVDTTGEAYCGPLAVAGGEGPWVRYTLSLVPTQQAAALVVDQLTDAGVATPPGMLARPDHQTPPRDLDVAVRAWAPDAARSTHDPAQQPERFDEHEPLVTSNAQGQRVAVVVTHLTVAEQLGDGYDAWRAADHHQLAALRVRTDPPSELSAALDDGYRTTSLEFGDDQAVHVVSVPRDAALQLRFDDGQRLQLADGSRHGGDPLEYRPTDVQLSAQRTFDTVADAVDEHGTRAEVRITAQLSVTAAQLAAAHPRADAPGDGKVWLTVEHDYHPAQLDGPVYTAWQDDELAMTLTVDGQPREPVGGTIVTGNARQLWFPVPATFESGQLHATVSGQLVARGAGRQVSEPHQTLTTDPVEVAIATK